MINISYYLEPIVKRWTNPGQKTKIISIAVISMLIISSWIYIIFLGKQSYIHLHLLYIATIIASIIFKLSGGLLIGLTNGIILGPISSWQLNGNIFKINSWIGGFFLSLMVGIISGGLLEILNDKVNKLAQQGYYNQITNLPNKQSLHMKLKRSINFNKIIDKEFVLLTISIDNFADIFSIIDYRQSDDFLRKVAQHFSEYLGDDDKLYHSHNNKFNILLYNYNKTEALNWTKKYSAFLQEPVMFNGIPVYLKTSIGLASYPEHSNEGDEIVNKSYVAMNKARANNLNYRWYHSNTDKISQQNFLLLGDVKEALRKEEFELHYQPKVDIKENKIVGLEALIRWNYPGRGYIPPNQFIPQVEQTGLINSLTSWVLEQAIKDWIKMKEAGFELDISINITARNLHDPDFIADIESILNKYDINPSFLEFEITERDIMEKFSQTKKVLNNIVRLGINISLDDFGTGHSSLAYLKYLPNETIKIDRAFIKDILIDDKDRIITKTAVKMAHLLNKTVVAEGVEDRQSIEVLKEMGCDMVQGYYISKPKSLCDIKDWFESSEFKI